MILGFSCGGHTRPSHGFRRLRPSKLRYVACGGMSQGVLAGRWGSSDAAEFVFPGSGLHWVCARSFADGCRGYMFHFMSGSSCASLPFG